MPSTEDDQKTNPFVFLYAYSCPHGVASVTIVVEFVLRNGLLVEGIPVMRARHPRQLRLV